MMAVQGKEFHLKVWLRRQGSGINASDDGAPRTENPSQTRVTFDLQIRTLILTMNKGHHWYLSIFAEGTP